MQTMTPPSHDEWVPKPLNKTGVRESVQLVEVMPGKSVSLAVLKDLLPDIETTLFFAKAYSFDFEQLSDLIRQLFPTPVIEALLGEGDIHSSELQDYIIDVVPDEILAEHGMGHYDEDRPAPDTELLSQLFESLTVTIADSILKVTSELTLVLDRLPSKYGSMTFQHLRNFNAQRATIGNYSAQIVHDPTPPRLVIFDVSGSVDEPTVKALADEVVGLSYAINASLAIVSDNVFLWEPGTFDTDDVLEKAEYMGTHYEMLTPVLDVDWDTVVCIADYDSAFTALEHLQRYAKGHIRQVYDISLVNRPTFLGQCLGLLADTLTPVLIGTSRYVTGSRYQQQGY